MVRISTRTVCNFSVWANSAKRAHVSTDRRGDTGMSSFEVSQTRVRFENDQLIGKRALKYRFVPHVVKNLAKLLSTTLLH